MGRKDAHVTDGQPPGRANHSQPRSSRRHSLLPRTRQPVAGTKRMGPGRPARVGRAREDDQGSLRSMANRTESSTVIDAAPGAVLDVIADFDSYPEWAAEVRKVAVLSEDGDGWADLVEFTLDAGAIKDTYVLE